MSYAQAAGAGASSGSNSGPQSKDKFYNEMVVCLIKGFTHEQLAEELNKAGIWKAVSGYQRVDFNRRIAYHSYPLAPHFWNSGKFLLSLVKLLR